MRHVIFVCFTFVLLVLLSACSPSPSPDAASPEGISQPSTVNPTAIPSSGAIDAPDQNLSEDSTSILPDPLAQQLKSFLAAETGIRTEAIALKQAQPMEWNNACLEVSKPEEFCAEVITPGYRVVLETSDGEYVVHTDRSGQTFRIAQIP